MRDVGSKSAGNNQVYDSMDKKISAILNDINKIVDKLEQEKRSDLKCRDNEVIEELQKKIEGYEKER